MYGDGTKRFNMKAKFTFRKQRKETATAEDWRWLVREKVLGSEKSTGENKNWQGQQNEWWKIELKFLIQKWQWEGEKKKKKKKIEPLQSTTDSQNHKVKMEKKNRRAILDAQK